MRRTYSLYPLGGRWTLTAYHDGHPVWTRTYGNRLRADLAAFWLRVRGHRPA